MRAKGVAVVECFPACVRPWAHPQNCNKMEMLFYNVGFVFWTIKMIP